MSNLLFSSPCGDESKLQKLLKRTKIFLKIKRVVHYKSSIRHFEQKRKNDFAEKAVFKVRNAKVMQWERG